MRTINLVALPFTFLAAAVLLGGCVGAEPGEEADEVADEVEPTTEAGAALQQQTSSASYNGVCGSGYNVIDSHALTGGTVYLTYSSSTGKNCVVTVRTTPGARLPMAARVSKAGQPWISDSGQFTTYAGPVYVYAPNACIDWGGTINGSNFNAFDTHCG